MKTFERFLLEQSNTVEFPDAFKANLAFLYDKLSSHLSYGQTLSNGAGQPDYWAFKYRVLGVLEHHSDVVGSLNAFVELLADSDWYHFKYVKQAWDRLDKNNPRHVMEWYNQSLLPSIRSHRGMYLSIKHHGNDVVYGDNKTISHKGHQTWTGPEKESAPAPATK